MSRYTVFDDIFMRPTVVLISAYDPAGGQKSEKPTEAMHLDAKQRGLPEAAAYLRARWPEKNSGIDFDYASRHRCRELARRASPEERKVWVASLSVLTDEVSYSLAYETTPEILLFDSDPRRSWLYSDANRARNTQTVIREEDNPAMWGVARGLRGRIDSLERFFQADGHKILFDIFKLVRADLDDGRRLSESFANKGNGVDRFDHSEPGMSEVLGEVLSELEHLRNLTKEHSTCFVARKCRQIVDLFFDEFEKLPKPNLYDAENIYRRYEEVFQNLSTNLESVLQKIKGIGRIRLLLPMELLSALTDPRVYAAKKVPIEQSDRPSESPMPPSAV